MSFVDTNVLVYATATGAPFQARARAALSHALAEGPVYLSRQILREYIAVMTRDQVWGKALTLAEAMDDAAVFSRRFIIAEDSRRVWDEFVALAAKVPFGGKQVHDANIVATMLAHGEHRLLTFNESDFRRFAALIEIVVP